MGKSNSTKNKKIFETSLISKINETIRAGGSPSSSEIEELEKIDPKAAGRLIRMEEAVKEQHIIASEKLATEDSALLKKEVRELFGVQGQKKPSSLSPTATPMSKSHPSFSKSSGNII